MILQKSGDIYQMPRYAPRGTPCTFSTTRAKRVHLSAAPLTAFLPKWRCKLQPPPTRKEFYCLAVSCRNGFCLVFFLVQDNELQDDELQVLTVERMRMMTIFHVFDLKTLRLLFIHFCSSCLSSCVQDEPPLTQQWRPTHIIPPPAVVDDKCQKMILGGVVDKHCINHPAAIIINFTRAHASVLIVCMSNLPHSFH